MKKIIVLDKLGRGNALPLFTYTFTPPVSNNQPSFLLWTHRASYYLFWKL